MKKRLMCIFALVLMSVNLSYANSDTERLAKDKAFEIAVATEWLFSLRDEKSIEGFQEEITKRPRNFIKMGKTIIRGGIPTRTEIPTYVLVYNQNSIVLFTIEDNTIKFYFGGKMSTESYEKAVINSSYLFMYLPKEEVHFTHTLHSIVYADMISQKSTGEKVLMNGQDPYNREVLGFGNQLVATTINIRQDLSREVLEDYMFSVWLGLELGLDLKAELDHVKNESAPVASMSCTEYLAK